MLANKEQDSKNLENLNETQQSGKRNQPVTDDWDNRLRNLITIADSKCKNGGVPFTPAKLRRMILMGFAIAALLIVLGLVISNSQASTLSHALELPDNERSDFLAGQLMPTASLVLATASIVIVLLTRWSDVIKPSSNSEWAQHYGNSLSKEAEKLKVSKNDLPYLKALIKMKSRDFDLSLEDSYHKSLELDSDLFSEKRLLESLYD